MLITVFTPTYNRAHLLHRLYESLCKQSFNDFEWVIVDDGSNDDTEEIVKSQFFNQNFTVRYYSQENGGKHRAVNRGVKEAKGELFFIADSDDILPSDALEIVAKQYGAIKNDNSFAGVAGLDGTFDGKVIGSGLPQDVIDDTSTNLRCKLGVTGDMKEVFRTDVLREFPFPEIKGEIFCPEDLIWNRIAKKYKLRNFNMIIYLAEYQNDGISAGITRARMNSPVASMMTYAELTQYDIPHIQKVKAAINYWRFRLCSHGKKDVKIAFFWHLLAPFGLLMHLNDKRHI